MGVEASGLLDVYEIHVPRTCILYMVPAAEKACQFITALRAYYLGWRYQAHWLSCPPWGPLMRWLAGRLVVRPPTTSSCLISNRSSEGKTRSATVDG